MDKMKFFIWSSVYKEGCCVIKEPVGVEKRYQLDEGISRADGWPADIVCKMNPEYPHDIQLANNLYGTGLAIVSKHIKEFLLIEEQINNAEFLPVTILNHKDRMASREFFIMNPLDVIDCIDIEESVVKWNAIDPTLIRSCEQLVLDEDRIPSDCKIFRPKFLLLRIIIRSELVEKLVSAGYTGLHFKDPLKYRGIA